MLLSTLYRPGGLHMSDNSITSPCIRNCCLDEQDMCVGCFRLLDEIIAWGDASPEQKQHILDNCQSRRQQRNPLSFS